MVIHNENDLPVEMAVIKKPLFEQEHCVLNKTHVQKHLNKQDISSSVGISIDLETMDKTKKRKSKKREASSSSSQDTELYNNGSQISLEDLQELKTVYKKCKSVMKKIESKYGHLLDLDSDEPNEKRSKYTTEDTHTCNCTLNKKIVFDDEGKVSTVETTPISHICLSKNSYDVQNQETQSISPTGKSTVTVEYTTSSNYPENLVVLSKMLRNSDSEINYQNQVFNRHQLIQKAYELKQEYLNEIRLNKQSLMEQLRKNPEEMLLFKGTNLASLPGYFST